MAYSIFVDKGFTFLNSSKQAKPASWGALWLFWIMCVYYNII